MYEPSTLFNFFLKKSIDTNVASTAVKLELMAYFAHGWHLAVINKPMINEPIKAWRHGPVIESLHFKFIKKDADLLGSLNEQAINALKPIDRFFLEGIWKHYGHLNELEMIELCHKDNTPWESTYEKKSGDIVIDNHRIKQHYRWLHVTHPDFSDLDDPMSEFSEVG